MSVLWILLAFSVSVAYAGEAINENHSQVIQMLLEKTEALQRQNEDLRGKFEALEGSIHYLTKSKLLEMPLI